VFSSKKNNQFLDKDWFRTELVRINRRAKKPDINLTLPQYIGLKSGKDADA